MKRQDMEALRDMVSQARLIVSTEPLIAGGIERARELLGTAERMADFLLSPAVGQVSARNNGRNGPRAGS